MGLNKTAWPQNRITRKSCLKYWSQYSYAFMNSISFVCCFIQIPSHLNIHFRIFLIINFQIALWKLYFNDKALNPPYLFINSSCISRIWIFLFSFHFLILLNQQKKHVKIEQMKNIHKQRLFFSSSPSTVETRRFGTVLKLYRFFLILPKFMHVILGKKGYF